MARSIQTQEARRGSSASYNASEPEPTLRESILNYMAAHNAMTIASCIGNVPWASAVFYANEGLDLYFLSNPSSRHGLNLEKNRKVSVAIHEDPNDWKEIRGIQLEGAAERVRSPKRKLLFWKIYRKKFPFVDRFFQPGSLHEMVKAKIAEVKIYRILPARILYLDNRKGFGHREELSLDS